VQWAILRGEVETGNSVIHMTPGLDAGPILMQQRTPIDPDEDAAELEARLAQMGADAVLDVIERLESNTALGVGQDERQASKAPRLKKEQGAIDWSRRCQEIKNRVRALRPWPRAYTFWRRAGTDPMRLNIDRVTIVDRPTPLAGSTTIPPPPGTVLECSPRLIVAASDGALAIDELQPAGKRSMPAADFVRGYRIQVGERLETA
jgi:methionyl-tRNA formyltransferase